MHLRWREETNNSEKGRTWAPLNRKHLSSQQKKKRQQCSQHHTMYRNLSKP
uniref:Uncharacterized protein n=1 Tax=Anguilla anguilla TaxID=7936 RepID=A0A0E9X000_ANGAN